MTISYAQGCNPYWYFSDLTGKPAGAGQVFFYSSLNPDNLKTVYQDSSGLLAYTNPININLNGTVPPIYFAVNSSDPADNYDIYAYDAEGNLIEQILNYTPPSGGGGSGTTILNLKNLVTNNVFYRHVGTISNPPVYQPLAPSIHQGLAYDPHWSPSSINATYGANIVFLKNNTSAIDNISFPVFALGLLPMSPSDITPIDYFQYSCTGAGSSENLKCVQFPITSKVQNLSNQVVSGTIWGICTSGNTALTISAVQYFGNGSAASNPTNTGNTVVTPLTSITLTNIWMQYNFTAQTIPSVSDGTLGQCGNDGLFLQVGLPLNEATTIGFTKPCLYLGSNYAISNYDSYDSISSIFDEPYTGDARLSLDNINTFWSFGWVPANDGSIGSASSGATTRANVDTFPLYNLLWNIVGATYAPMVDSNPYGSSATVDFAANRAIYLTKQAGRLLAGIGLPSSGNNTGTTWVVGQTAGNEQTNQVANHTHNYDRFSTTAGSTYQGGSTYNPVTTATATTNPNSGGVTNVNIQNPVSYQVVYVKL